MDCIIEFSMKTLIFIESGMTPISLFWASASTVFLKYHMTPQFIWTFSILVYILNGIFLEIIPGKLCQPNTSILNIKTIFPNILLNLMSTFVLTFIPIHSHTNLNYIQVIIYLLIAGIGNEFIYALTHRFLHTPLMFKYHRLHHTQTAPRALGAVYCSLTEMWFANLSSFIIPLYLTGAPIQIYFIWIISGIQTTQLHHSGKKFKWSLGHQPQFHDDHHKFVKTNYGNIGFLEKFL